ncbi:unnamed protein product [marine sediment metagenome]|uniref:CobQ/CobB/MinD/ParA nucleotide binding domain-containing protein n=1 Tax=marine sediment metagenome TaxID=412755 RepID=X1CDH8_9ZZZZ
MKTITITSGKGGVGKSIVSVNLGLALAQRSQKVLLFDADLSLANDDILLGLSCEHTLFDVLDGSKTLDEILVTAPYGMKLLPASSGILKLERLSPSHRLKMATNLRDLASSFDLLLVDTGAGLTENVLFFTSTADEALLVTTPEPTAVTDTYAMIKVLAASYDVGSIALLVNRVSNPQEGIDIHKKLSGVTEKFLGQKIAYLGHLPYDPAIEMAVQKREPLLTGSPHSPAGNAFVTLARHFDKVFTCEPRSVVTDLWDQLLSPES